MHLPDSVKEYVELVQSNELEPTPYTIEYAKEVSTEYKSFDEMASAVHGELKEQLENAEPDNEKTVVADERREAQPDNDNQAVFNQRAM